MKPTGTSIAEPQPQSPEETKTGTSPETYDVVVVGYGPVGRMLALKLGTRRT